jgi:hypothetical protein
MLESGMSPESTVNRLLEPLSICKNIASLNLTYHD